MKIRIRALLMLTTLLLTGCLGQAPPEEMSFDDLTIVVWDVREPHFPGLLPYSETMSKLLDDFAQNTGISVKSEFKSRQQIEDLLLGEQPDEMPAVLVVFSTEWPFVGKGTQEAPSELDAGNYFERAVAYWTCDGKLMGIPSYIHWLCQANKNTSSGLFNKTGYFPSAQGFLRCVLDYQPMDWVLEDICDYAQWVKDTYGLCREPALDLWEQGRVGAMYPVTPYLFKWLRLSEKGGETQMLPIDNPQKEGRFVYSVPAYVVLAENPAKAKLAFKLAQALAAQRGRWAARALGCIPACTEDIPIFHIESGLSREEQLCLMVGFKNSSNRALTYLEHDRRRRLEQSVSPAIQKYLSGMIGPESFVESIRSALTGHNN